MWNFFKKIKNGIKDGKFWFRLKIVWRQKRLKSKHVYYISNGIVKNLQEEDKWLKKFKKRYANLIEEGIPEPTSYNLSNKVWMLWLTGLDTAPDVVKACYNSVKRNMPEKEVIFLTEENVFDYITLPKHIMEKRKKQLIGHAHFADIIRLELLCTHGGMWIDSTVLCTGAANDYTPITTAPFFIYHDLLDEHVRRASNWLIVNNSNSQLLALTKKLVYQYWKDYNYAVNYLFLDLLMALASRRYPQEWDNMPPYNNFVPRIMQKELSKDFSETRWQEYLNMASFHKLTHNFKFTNTPNSTLSHILETYKDD